MQNNNPICVFDSGVGGLTVLSKLIQLLPKENYVYLADTKFLPYGTKSSQQICHRVQKVVSFFHQFEPKVIVIACNTASLFHCCDKLDSVVPVFDVITPTCNCVATLGAKKVCLLGTDLTVSKGVYQRKLAQCGCDVVAVSCSNFVRLVENFDSHKDKCENIVTQSLQQVSQNFFDALIYGCTHFDFLHKWIAKVLRANNYVSCGLPCAIQVSNYLGDKNIFAKCGGSVRCLCTGKVPSTKFLQVNENVCCDFSVVNFN